MQDSHSFWVVRDNPISLVPSSLILWYLDMLNDARIFGTDVLNIAIFYAS